MQETLPGTTKQPSRTVVTTIKVATMLNSSTEEVSRGKCRGNSKESHELKKHIARSVTVIKYLQCCWTVFCEQRPK